MWNRDRFVMICIVGSIQSTYLKLFDQFQVGYGLSRVVENDGEVVEDS